LLVNPFPSPWASKIPGWACVAAVIGLMMFAGDPYFRLLRKRASHQVVGKLSIYRHVDEAAGTTTAFGGEGGWVDKVLWVNGAGMTQLCSLTKMLSHLPIWLADDPKDMLVICLGMGTSLRSAASHPNLDITVVELIPAIYDCIGFFHEDGREILKRPNVHPVVDDGRNYLLMNDKKYDVITIDPAPPLYAAGTVNLHTREFFELCRSRLKPGGKLCMWVPAYGRSELPMILKSYVDVFEHIRGFASASNGLGGFMLIGSLEPFDDVEGKIRRAFQEKPAYADLVEYDNTYSTPEKVQDLYLGDREGFRAFVGNFAGITDDRPYLEFPLWRMLFHMNDFYEECNTKAYRSKMGIPAAKIGSGPGLAWPR
jgi:spermidine synthase